MGPAGQVIKSERGRVLPRGPHMSALFPRFGPRIARVWWPGQGEAAQSPVFFIIFFFSFYSPNLSVQINLNF
jgi:hypothetical protein